MVHYSVGQSGLSMSACDKGGSLTAGEIASTFEHAWPTTTRHLQVLESAGLLRHERQGRVKPWGERSFYAEDNWHNPLCFVEAGTIYPG